ncbi:MAG: S9 family peptidase [Candidatus Aminicenantes bacterium]|nr:S9 family peptidase [Candidatus Aminicenantes bacterium]
MIQFRSFSQKFLLGGFLIFFFSGLVLAELPDLIPREVLFGNPQKTMLRLSPDGKFFSYLAPSKKGVLNVWVKTFGKEDDRMVTIDTHRGIRFYGWTWDSQHIVYFQDKDGDENWHAYLVNLKSNIIRDLTPFQGIRAQNFILDKKHPHEMLIGLNLRTKRLFDMHRINLKTGAVELDTKNPGGIIGWAADHNFVIRAATFMNPMDGSTIIKVRDGKDKPWRDLLVLPFGENGGFVEFTTDGNSAYVETSVGFDTTRLVEMDLKSGKITRTISSDKKCDVGAIIRHPDKHHIQAVSFNYLMAHWEVLDESIKADFDILGKARVGNFGIVSRDLIDQKWVVWYDVDDGTLTYHLYDRAKKDLKFILEARPELKKYQLTKMKPVLIKARDGMKMVSYLSLPIGVKSKKLAMVLLVHGGPWARDIWGLDPMVQWLTNRGYAVLQVNFRGSAGFGKKFLNAGNLQWGVGSMQHDLDDAVKWAIKKGYADPKKVAIMGGSYGGYATLAGLTFTPELYVCGVDIVGPSNIRTLFKAIPPYWAPLKKMFTMRVGDVEKDDAFNKKISPLFHVANIKAPLLIGQGKNDPRVNIQESNQIVKAMRDKKLPVKYIVYPDEGHGFARPENRLDFYGYVDEFLGKHLGGRVESHKKVKGATGEVR